MAQVFFCSSTWKYLCKSVFSLICNKINPKQNKIKPLRQSPYNDIVLEDENERDYESNWYSHNWYQQRNLRVC